MSFSLQTSIQQAVSTYCHLCCGHTVAFLMAFHPDLCDRDDTGMIGTVSEMKSPENGRVGESRGESSGNGKLWRLFQNVQDCRGESP